MQSFFSDRKDKVKLQITVTAVFLISITLFTVLGNLILELKFRDEREEVHEVLREFHHEVEDFIVEKIVLMKGFSALIEIQEPIDNDDIEKVLQRLLKEEETEIKSVSLIEGSKVRWIYPYEDNKAFIGLDLKNNQEFDRHLEIIKQSERPLIDGPVQLVHGESGYVISIPISKEGQFWGCISLNIDKAFVNGVIRDFEENNEVSIYIQNQLPDDRTVYGISDITNYNPIQLIGKIHSSEWNIFMMPLGGWKYDDLSLKFLVTLISAGISFMISFSTYSRMVKVNFIIEKKGFLEDEIVKDRFTGIYNRSYFDKRVIEEMAQADRNDVAMSMIYFDLDHFKIVNDTYGHSEGDKVLLTVKETVESQIRKGDIFARWGGDEFVLLMPYTGLDGAIFVADKIKRAIENIKFESGAHVTSSMGISERVSNEYWHSWFNRTDRALYQSKENGRNQYTISISEENEKIVKKIIWKKQWECGDPIIDNAHKNLVVLANELIESGYEVLDKDYYLHQIQSLFKHVEIHFDEEEKLLFEIKYPKLNEHVEAHHQLKHSFEIMYQKAVRNELSNEMVFRFLFQKLIIEHMLVMDLDYFSYVKK